jgi:small-conductance mechanosensitive channel
MRSCFMALILSFSLCLTNGFVVPVPVRPLERVPLVRSGQGRLTTALKNSPVNSVVKRSFGKNSIVKGKLYRGISKFLVSPRRALEIVKALAVHVAQDLDDIALIALCIRAPLPLARRFYWTRHKALDPHEYENKFLESKTKKIATVVNEIGILLGFLYLVDIGLFILDHLQFDWVTKFPVQTWTAGIVTSLWSAKNLSELKYFALTRGKKIDIRRNSGTRLLNRFADILIYVGTLVAILDFLSVQTGFALKSLFGLSSVGTLVFSLASKELVSEFLASLAIQGTNMYSEGETILLKDGTNGIVQKLGWLNTHIRRSDEVVVRIPNTQISGARLANISRTKFSAIKQGIAISYEEMDKVPQLIEDIKTEIRAACPTLIDDSSRKFRIFWSNYEENSLEIVVDAKFRTRPKCDDYYLLKQEVLLAISRATKKNKIQFSYVNTGNAGTPLLD